MAKTYFYSANGEVRFADSEANCEGVIGNPEADAELQAWLVLGNKIAAAAAAPNTAILAQISVLETSVTPRRLREAVLGLDNGWLNGINDQIAALRGKLTK